MNQALRQRILLAVAVLLMLVPTFLLAAGKIGQPPIFDGDQRLELTCIVCDGMGRVDADTEEKCAECRGTGIAEYIVPGDLRPIQLVGTVLDSAGAVVPDAEVRGFELSLEEAGPQVSEFSLTVYSNDSGQFGLKLPPGHYRLEIEHDAGKMVEDLEVQRIETPLLVRGQETLHRMDRSFTLSQEET